MLKPVHEMTRAEFDALPDDERFKYQNLGGPGPSHNNYWICAIVQHIQFGGKISQRIWDGLGEHEKTYLKFAVKGLGNDNFVAA